MPLRLKGQEVSGILASATVGIETSFSNIKSLDVQFDREILSEGYLGQTTEQKDDIYKGVSGTMTLHSGDAGVLSVIQRMNEVTRRRLPGEVFRISAVYVFPIGGARQIVIPEVKIGNIPISSPSRDDFVLYTIEFAADEGRILAA